MNWSRLGTEGFVIVASILLALWLEAVWSGIQTKARAYVELSSVLEELEEAHGQIDQVASWHQRVLANTMELEARLNAAPIGDRISVPDTLLTTLFVVGVTEASTSMLDVFTQSGHLNEIGSEELRRRLLGWRPILDDLQDDELRIREFADREISPYLVTRVPMEAASRHSNEMWLGTIEPAAAGESELDVTLTLRNMVSWQVGATQLLSGQAVAALESLQEVTTLVEAELGGR